MHFPCRLIVLDLGVREVLHHDRPRALPHGRGEVGEAAVVRVVLADDQDHRVVRLDEGQGDARGEPIAAAQAGHVH